MRSPAPYTRGAALPALLAQRIVIIDGAMGTLIQRFMLTEADFRGERFRDHPKDLKGNNDLLVLTRPDVVRRIHDQYLAAGADIIETNTFGATSIAQADYGLAGIAHEMNVAAARLARAACDAVATAERPRFVAGALGPTPRTASISPDVNDPAARNVGFEELRAAYHEQASGLLEGGCDLFLVETIWPLAVGLNCALGAALMRPYIEELAKVAGDTFISCYPNAGLPNPMSETGFDETPEVTAGMLAEFARAGFVNIVGGCCGTTPEHIAEIARRVSAYRPRSKADPLFAPLLAA